MKPSEILSSALNIHGISLGDKGYTYLDKIERDVYKKLLFINPEDFIKEYCVSVQSGESEYSLPRDYENLQARTCGLFKIENGKKIRKYVEQPEKYSSSTGFHIAKLDDKLYMTPKPTADVELTLIYVPRRTKINSSTNNSYSMLLSRYSTIDDFEDYYRLRLFLEYLKNETDYADPQLLTQTALEIKSIEKEWIDNIRQHPPQISLTLYRPKQLNGTERITLK